MVPFTLLPDAGHLPGLFAIACVAALSVGLGSLVGARRTDAALIAGWGVTGFATVVFGTLTDVALNKVMLLAGLLGAIGLVRAVALASAGRPVLAFATMARVLLLSVPLFVLLESIEPASWDDFSHWLPNSLYLAATGHFPTLVRPNEASIHPGYPYGAALPAFGASLLGPQWSDTTGIFWNTLLLLAACSSIADLIQEQRNRTLVASPKKEGFAWVSAGLGLLFGGLLCPTFTPKFALSNTADGATSAVLAVMCKLAFDALGAPGAAIPPLRTRRSELWVFACCGVALINLRQTNAVLFALLLVGLAVGVLLCRRSLDPADFKRVGPSLLLATILFLLWNSYAARQIPGGQFSFLPIDQWRWSMLQQTLASIAREIVVKGGFFALLGLLGVYSCLTLRRSEAETRLQGILPITVLVLSFGNVAFVAFSYLAADFQPSEAAHAASFWRYCEQTGLAVVLALVLLAPPRWLEFLASRRAAAVVCAGAALAPPGAPNFVRYDARSLAPLYRLIGEDIFDHWTPGTPIRLLDTTGNGYTALVAAYQIRQRALQTNLPTADVTVVSTPEGLTWDHLLGVRENARETHMFIWLAEGDGRTAGLFSQPLHAGCSYLLEAAAGHVQVTRSWSLHGFSDPRPQKPGLAQQQTGTEDVGSSVCGLPRLRPEADDR